MTPAPPPGAAGCNQGAAGSCRQLRSAATAPSSTGRSGVRSPASLLDPHHPPHPTTHPPTLPGGRIGDKFPVVVTSYEILLADIKFMAKYQWKYIVVDEARAREGGLGCGAGEFKPGSGCQARRFDNAGRLICRSWGGEASMPALGPCLSIGRVYASRSRRATA